MSFDNTQLEVALHIARSLLNGDRPITKTEAMSMSSSANGGKLPESGIWEMGQVSAYAVKTLKKRHKIKVSPLAVLLFMDVYMREGEVVRKVDESDKILIDIATEGYEKLNRGESLGFHGRHVAKRILKICGLIAAIIIINLTRVPLLAILILVGIAYAAYCGIMRLVRWKPRSGNKRTARRGSSNSRRSAGRRDAPMAKRGDRTVLGPLIIFGAAAAIAFLVGAARAWIRWRGN